MVEANDENVFAAIVQDLPLGLVEQKQELFAQMHEPIDEIFEGDIEDFPLGKVVVPESPHPKVMIAQQESDGDQRETIAT